MSDGTIRRQTGPLITPISTPKPAPKIEPPKAPEPPKEAPKTESKDTLQPPTADATREAIAGPIDPRQLENLRGTFTTLDAAMDFAAQDKGSELIQSFEIEGQTVYTVQDLDTRQQAESLMSEEVGLAMVLDQNRGLDILNTAEASTAPPENRMAELLKLAEGAALNEHTALNSREGLKHGQLQKNLGQLMQGLVEQHAVLHAEIAALPPDSPRVAQLKNQMQEAELMYLALKTRMQILPDSRQRNPQTGLVIKGTGVPIPAMPTMSDWGKALDKQPSENIVGCLRSQPGKVQTQIEGYIKAVKGSPEANTPHGQRALNVYQSVQGVFGNLSAQAQQAQGRTDQRKQALGAISDALQDAQQQLRGYKQELQSLDTALQQGTSDLGSVETRVHEIGNHLNQVHGRLLGEMEIELGNFRAHVSENKAGGKAAIALLEGQILKLRAVADAPPHTMLAALEEALPQWQEGAWLKELAQAGRSFEGITPGEVTQVGQVVDQTKSYLEARGHNQVKQAEVQGQVKVQKLARELEAVATEALHLKPASHYPEATGQLQILSAQASDMQAVLGQHLEGVEASPEWQALELVKDLLHLQQQPPSAGNTPEAQAKLKADIQNTLGMIREPDVHKAIALMADLATERVNTHTALKQLEGFNLPEIEVREQTYFNPADGSTTTTHTGRNAPDLKDNPLQASEVEAVQSEVNHATLDLLIEHYDKASERFEAFAQSDDRVLDLLVAEARRLETAQPDTNRLEGITRIMNIYLGGADHQGTTQYRVMADAILKLARGGDRNNPYVQNTVLPYLREGISNRLETMKERAAALKNMKAGGLNGLDQTVANLMHLSPEKQQVFNRKRVDDFVLNTLQKNPHIRKQVFERMGFKHSPDKFPSAENLPQKPVIENFSSRKEALFVYQAAHEGEPSVGDFLEGVVKDLPGIKTVVQAMEAYDKEVGASAHVNSIDEAAKAKRAVVVGIVETIGTTGLDIMTGGATRALRLKGVVASVVENTVSAGADSLMNDSNFFENLGKGMVVGKVFELGGKALDLRINKNRDMSITTPDGKTLHGKVLDLAPHSGQITVKLDGSDKPLKLDMKLHSRPQTKQNAVEILDMEQIEFTAPAPQSRGKAIEAYDDSHIEGLRAEAKKQMRQSPAREAIKANIFENQPRLRMKDKLSKQNFINRLNKQHPNLPLKFLETIANNAPVALSGQIRPIRSTELGLSFKRKMANFHNYSDQIMKGKTLSAEDLITSTNSPQTLFTEKGVKEARSKVHNILSNSILGTNGIFVKTNGMYDFSPVEMHRVDFSKDYTGAGLLEPRKFGIDSKTDMILADRMAAQPLYEKGWIKEPSAKAVAQLRHNIGLVWHHHEDLKTMQLIPKFIHDSHIPHIGGDSLSKEVIKHSVSKEDYQEFVGFESQVPDYYWK